ncbi:hypothetical protein SAMN05428944_3611 [Streptomyces sp. 1222.5]|uniref:hypothetical protein n=1 Tax=unclassified Streptomyces TaxID=2593676 RepID=UPI000898BDC4|nr:MULTISPECIES: hypothetical protein [unclassified Streptomyces]PKW09235.1 hypothetical protein BX260_4482 [Streptomyces sp. 5112.2]SEC40919.1 hypothetical protein SAMN05428944_3611 [Streptomyces sp. 1222.5]
MDYARTSAELLAEEELPGLTARARDHLDTFLVRHRACWLVAEHGGVIIAARVAAEGSRVFAERRRLPSGEAGVAPGFVSPLPDGGLAVAASGSVTVYDADARVRWRRGFEPWSDARTAGPACVTDGGGSRLLVTTTGPGMTDRPYPGDRCVVLELSDGRTVTHTTLPSASAGYILQQSLTDPAQIFLDALQGDTFHSRVLTLEGDTLRAEPFGDDEPFAGVSVDGAVVQLDVGGDWICRCAAGSEEVLVEAEDVLPEGLRFVGHRAGFLDPDRIVVAVAEEEDTEDNRHLILDGRTLQPVGELDYPGTTCSDPLALGDGTWLTTEGDLVRRWRVPPV